MKKEKQGVDIVRSSAAEYLTFITATGKSDVNAVYFDECVAYTKDDGTFVQCGNTYN